MLAARDEHGLAPGALAEPPRGLARVGGRSDPHVRHRLRLVVVRRDHRRARVVLDVRHLRIDEQRDAVACAPRPRRPRRPAASRRPSGSRRSTIACADAASSPILRDDGGLDRRRDLAVALVVDPRHLLVARRHHAQLPRRAARRVADDARRADRAPGEILEQPRAVGVAADDADRLDAAAERDDVVGDVGGAAEPLRLVVEADDRHRRFRRDPLDPADDELIEHQVADDQDGAAGEAIEQLSSAGQAA